MEYINGNMTGVQDTRPKVTKVSDGRLYLSEMTWEEIETQYLKPIAKRSKNNGHNITDKGDSSGIQSYPER